MLLPQMSKQGRDCQTFVPKEMFSKKDETLVPLIYNYKQFNIVYQYLWVTYIIWFSCHFQSVTNFFNLYVNFFT